MITERRDVFRMSVCVKNLHLNGIDLDLEVGIISLEAEIEDLWSRRELMALKIEMEF